MYLEVTSGRVSPPIVQDDDDDDDGEEDDDEEDDEQHTADVQGLRPAVLHP